MNKVKTKNEKRERPREKRTETSKIQGRTDKRRATKAEITEETAEGRDIMKETG